MYVPSFLVVLPCLAAFVLSAQRYYVANPENRITDRRFLLSVLAVATIFAFMLARVFWPNEARVSEAFLLFALSLLGVAIWMFRQPLHPPAKPAG
jgi:hypothetical protein